MRYEIRALSFSEILDTGFRLLRDHFLVLFGIGFVLYGPLAVLGEAAQTLVQSGHATIALGIYGLAVILFAVLPPITSGAMILAVAERYLGGEMGFAEAFRGSLPRMLALVGTYLLMSLGIVLGALLLVLPGVYLMLAWMLATQIVMLEELAGPSALGRSRALLKDNMGRALGVLTVSTLILAVPTGALQLLLSGVPVVGSLVTALAQSVAFAYYTAVGVVLYFDLRCRKENFDIELLAQVVESRETPSGALGQES